MIDRVEVVRGGGSALFGASAIGGTINIITKEAMRSSAGISHELTSIGMSGALDNNTSMNASMVTDNGRGGLFVFGQRRSRDGYDADNDGFTEIPTLNTITVGTRGHLRINPFSKLKFEYHGVKEFRRGGNRLDRPAHEALIAEQIEHINNSGSISYGGQSQGWQCISGILMFPHSTSAETVTTEPEWTRMRMERRLTSLPSAEVSIRTSSTVCSSCRHNSRLDWSTISTI